MGACGILIYLVIVIETNIICSSQIPRRYHVVPSKSYVTFLHFPSQCQITSTSQRTPDFIIQPKLCHHLSAESVEGIPSVVYIYFALRALTNVWAFDYRLKGSTRFIYNDGPNRCALPVIIGRSAREYFGEIIPVRGGCSHTALSTYQRTPKSAVCLHSGPSRHGTTQCWLTERHCVIAHLSSMPESWGTYFWCFTHIPPGTTRLRTRWFASLSPRRSSRTAILRR